MTLTPKQLAEYKRIYKEDFGEELTDQEAISQATGLINLMKVICRPISSQQIEDFNKTHQDNPLKLPDSRNTPPSVSLY